MPRRKRHHTGACIDSEIAAGTFLDSGDGGAHRPLHRLHNIARIRRERRAICLRQLKLRFDAVALPNRLIERGHRCAGQCGRIIAAITPAEPIKPATALFEEGDDARQGRERLHSVAGFITAT